MTTEHLYNLAWNVASLGLLVLSLRALRATFIAEFRLSLFEIRHRLLVAAASGVVSREHPAYWRLTMNLNGVLATAEDLSFGRSLLFAVKAHNYPGLIDRLVASTQEELRSLRDPSARMCLDQLHEQLSIAIGRHMKRLIWTSPFMCLLGPMTVIGKMIGLQQRLRAEASKWVVAEGQATKACA
jgi:hypothetical protein